VALGLSGCNTVAGTVDGVGRDLSAVGNTLSGVSGDECGRPRCGDRYDRRSSRASRYVAVDRQQRGRQGGPYYHRPTYSRCC
jgi:predicted small secreted protein